jgi:uncharacterized damage-inducible protein DinB
MAETGTSATGERAEFLGSIARQRKLLRHTTRDLTDEQIAQRACASELCLGGIIKHVTRMEHRWATFILEGTKAMEINEGSMADHAASFRMEEGDTLASLLGEYERAAHRTDEIVIALPNLDDSHELPEAPWFPPRTRWTFRQVLLHILAETAQHSGHADVVREQLDGAKTM